MKKTGKLLSLLVVICMLLSSCAQGAGEVVNAIADDVKGNNAVENVISNMGITNSLSADNTADQISASNKNDAIPEKGTYNEGVVLVKYDGEFNENVLAQLDFVSADPLYKGSSWYTVTLGESMDTVGAVKYLTELDCFEKVDYDYVMKADGEVQSVDISGNTYAEGLTYLDTLGVKKGWENNANNKKNPGGSADVIIAIIDTGVDYNHLDLRNNIWVNPAEIPDNGIDDDNNGYVDDIHGWDCVGDDNDPMDDNGHGTHVAGIAAAENNKIGTVGIAYNCKIMVLKAGNFSGYFNNSDIAEAVQYAYMNGASVINMSFGGSSISLAVEEALENAYNSCVLVAAAGNNHFCNFDKCQEFGHIFGVAYPAALPYVIGVMSCNANGSEISGFSNYDHVSFDSIEYEVLACGEQIPSTWPNNKYATLSGTSMAAPTVSGIAAVLRATYPDREAYSNKYIQSQIVNTGTKMIEGHSVANLYEAMTKTPLPNVKFYDYTIDDNLAISDKNNGNGVIDAGETVRLFIALQNRGGVASNVNVTINTMRNNDPSLVDPYFTLVNTAVMLSDIGTYSVREANENQYFEIVVSEECPNDYLVNFNLQFTYANGVDESDTTVYSGEGVARFNVSRGYRLPNVILEDTVFTADRLYIIANNITIPVGVTVTFEEGCQIQFYDESVWVTPEIAVYGTLIMQGSKENMINIYPSERFEECSCCFIQYAAGSISFDYVNAKRLWITTNDINITNTITVSNSYIEENGYVYRDGKIIVGPSTIISVNQISNCYIKDFEEHLYADIMDGNVFCIDAGYSYITCYQSFANNVVYSYIDGTIKQSGITLYNTVKNNTFLCNDIDALTNLDFTNATSIGDNYFSELYRKYTDAAIGGYISSTGNIRVNLYDSCEDVSILPPHIINIALFDSNGEEITTVGREEIKVRVTFNRPMDRNAGTFLTFGTIEPYADYRIDGAYISDTVWEGTYTLKAQIENGQNFLNVNNARAAEGFIKSVFGEGHLHEFTIDTTVAMSMNLQATTDEGKINLSWIQDDYDTLLGYNIYRSTEKDGNFVRMNPAIIPAGENTFIDNNTEPGVQYWYTFTVVLTDFTESNPAGKVTCTALDTILPNIYHTPVNQGYLNNNLVISATATDNIGVQTVTLYYRVVGSTEWKTLAMSKQNDKFSATVFGSELTLAGLEYYIVASDGVGSIEKGSATTPYTVVIKDASSISRIGDVDGDGTVTTKDALMLMQAINDDIILSDDEFKRADLDGNGTLNSAEALRILQYINGNVTTLEM